MFISRNNLPVGNVRSQFAGQVNTSWSSLIDVRPSDTGSVAFCDRGMHDILQ